MGIETFNITPPPISSGSVYLFTSELLDHPVYTRPPEFRGLKVPDVLTGGDHAKIDTWRAMKRRELTSRQRPDLLDNGLEKESPDHQ